MINQKHITDPFELKKLPKLHPYRLVWTAYSRLLDSYGKVTQIPISSQLKSFVPEHVFKNSGSFLPETAVTSNQLELLKIAIATTEYLSEPLAEIGSYRGATTQKLAQETKRLIYAVDPYIGYGGWESDLDAFKEKVEFLPNVNHLRMTSGMAFKQLQNKSLSMVFIDAVHDFSNTWFDFCSWSSLVVPGGLIAMHDVDYFPGTNLAFRKIIAQTNKYSLWGYCPNIAIVKKLDVND